jgi:prephenate dehydrogenase
VTRPLPVVQPAPGGSEPPLFARIGIVGLGLIGGSVALACRERWPTSLVIGVDRNEVLEQAMVRHAVDVGADDLGMLAEADLVVLAAPVDANVALIASLAEAVRGEAVVTDVGSTKRDIVEAARVLPSRLTFVGGHPLGGAARGGFEWAKASLFADRPWLFTPVDERAGGTLEKLMVFARALGARPVTMSPAEHDRVLAYLSHLPQLAASALMAVVGEAVGEERLSLAGRGLVDTTRLASSPAEVWAGICESNADRIGPALDALIECLAGLRSRLADRDAIGELFGAAAGWRSRLPPKP